MKRRKDMNKEEKRNRAILILSFYFIFFACLIGMILTNKEKQENNNTSKTSSVLKEETRSISELMISLQKLNYEYEYNLEYNLEKLFILGEKNILKEAGISKYQEEETVFVIDEFDKYQVIDDKYVKNNDLDIYKDFDTTFLSVEILNKLLNLRKDKEEEIIDQKTEETSYINLSDLIKIYNTKNLTNYLINTEELEKIKIIYDQEEIEIELDLTQLYKITSNKNNTSIYKLKYSNIGKVNLKNVLNN